METREDRNRRLRKEAEELRRRQQDEGIGSGLTVAEVFTAVTELANAINDSSSSDVSGTDTSSSDTFGGGGGFDGGGAGRDF